MCHVAYACDLMAMHTCTSRRLRRDTCPQVPMLGTKNSLNIAAAAPVVLFEVLRQWGALGAEVEAPG